MRLVIAIVIGKIIFLFTQFFKLGAGGTWPGEVALRLQPNLLEYFSNTLRRGVIIVAGTNGKTTTSLMITQILESRGDIVVHNSSGANLLNGIISAFIQKSDWLGNVRGDWGVLEVDENSLSAVMSNVKCHMSNENRKLIIVLLNLFRDQLDRYGEVDVISQKWQKVLSTISAATFILNCDDPLIAHIGKISTRPFLNNNVIYFGIEDKKQFIKTKEHAQDSTFCLNCGARLSYEGIYFSHLGIWKCTQCGEKRPKPTIFEYVSPLPGQYNLYNTLAAVSVVKALDIEDSHIKQTLSEFKPAFGRQEVFSINGKYIKLFLSKNPTGFNASLRTVIGLNPHGILLVLNDRIPDGRDVSWIWDVDFEMIPNSVKLVVSGDRVYDLALRIKYARQKIQNSRFDPPRLNEAGARRAELRTQNLIIESDFKQALSKGLDAIEKHETLYILATYSAMLEVRKIVTGKKIL